MRLKFALIIVRIVVGRHNRETLHLNLKMKLVSYLVGARGKFVQLIESYKIASRLNLGQCMTVERHLVKVCITICSNSIPLKNKTLLQLILMFIVGTPSTRS